MMNESQQGIGLIGNYYGGVEVCEKDGQFYWGVENFDGIEWEEIPESLYDELIKFEKENPNDE